MEPTKTFRDLYKALDPKTRNVIGFSDFDMFVAEVVKPYSLNEEQLATLVRLIVHVMVGIEKIEEFSAKISELIKTTPETSAAIANDIVQKIINNIDALYTKILLLEGDMLDEDEEVFVKAELCKEVRQYQKNINPREIVNVLRGTPFIPDIEHVVTFLKQSPQLIQKSVLSSGWSDKVNEVGLKYSLTPNQIQILISEVLLVIMELENREHLVENLEHTLNISTILAEQLTEEISTRILKLTEKNTKQLAEPETPTPHASYTPGEPPANLPGEIIENENNEQQNTEPTPPTQPTPSREMSFAGTPQTPFASAQSVQTNPSTLYTPENKPVFSFKASSSEPLIKPATQTPPPPQTPTQKPSFISSKLSQPTRPQTPPFEAPKTYTVDPYREPIE